MVRFVKTNVNYIEEIEKSVWNDEQIVIVIGNKLHLKLSSFIEISEKRFKDLQKFHDLEEKDCLPKSNDANKNIWDLIDLIKQGAWLARNQIKVWTDSNKKKRDKRNFFEAV